MAETVEEPGYAADETTEEGFVRLKVKIQGLKVKSRSFFEKFFSKHPLPEGKNAEIENPIYTEKSFELNVKGTQDGALKGTHYRLKIQQLPYSVEVSECYLNADDGWIFVFLKKADESQSWERYIRDGSLDVAGKEQN